MLQTSFALLAAWLYHSGDLAGPLAWQKLSAAPGSRFAFTAVHVPSRHSVLVFAGEVQKPGDPKSGPQFDLLHDLWEHDLEADRWQAVETKGPAPGDVAYHSAVFDPKRDAMWVFGGCDRSFSPNADLWRLDVAKRTWKKLDSPGDRPPARFSANLHYGGKRDRLLLHGGCKAFLQSDNAFPEVWTYGIEENTWTKRASGPARWQAAAALCPEIDSLVLHGGYDSNFTPKADTWIYRLEKDAWAEAGKGFKTTDAHAAVWDPESKLVLFDGGATAGERALEGVWSFDPLKKRWKELAVKGAGPGPRAYHAAVLLPDGNLWVFGGTENQFNDPMRGAEAWIAKIRT